ncbi:Nudix family hydrolase [Ectothiorhodospira lacustris]|uniref:Nudix family hydrolase n=1 Tax=Ectothiorhodospira lacustris TaxID=2899127 RepID=UPI001EE96FAB|nr:Nudix family hydrolase [Ectothiorhodospira lacustris]MCG5500998.1 Nudix family hydrolase [Ectothiorhodospira lacustris]MCG5510550.1 Nudix family hydrolase [Ectothiorhodospira lacustris]MCG5521242.1 Nudix family hydrolase [Ectothiorhodospira lacustris]
MTEPLRVAVAAIANDRDEYLIARRPEHVHQGGLWEFPGGKIEPGETLEAALRRELREELDITPLRHHPLITLNHDYPDRRVCLEVVKVDRFEGEPRGMEGQPLRWVAAAQLHALDFPAANRAIIKALILPDCLVITPDLRCPETLLDGLNRTLDAGRVRLLQLRAPGLSREDFVSLAAAVIPLCHAQGAGVVLNAEPELAISLGADGVHLNSRRLASLAERPEVSLVGCSVHQRGELEKAIRLGVDFVLVSPVAPTHTHPGAPVLGWRRFEELARQAGRPAYALGGMTVDDISAAQRHGGQGIAGIRGLWQGVTATEGD